MKKIISNTLLAGLVLVPLACFQNGKEIQPPTAEPDSKIRPRVVDEVSGQAPVRLFLNQEESTVGKVKVGLSFFLEEGREGPRMAEVFLKTSANLKYVGNQAGDAAQTASKDVIVQEKADSTVRVTVFSSANLNTLESGGIAVLEFEVLATEANTATVQIVPKDAMLAPAGVSEGLELGKTLNISL